MNITHINRLLAGTALATILAALPLTAASALPVLFGGDSVTVDGVSGSVTNIEPGQEVTATELLQLVAEDGSIITIEPGSVFRLTGEGDNISFDLVSGAMRVMSNGMPVSISRDGVTITSSSGAFSAFSGDAGGLEGRVNQGMVQVATASGTREFSKGEGYVATATSIAGTFTPPTPSATQMAQNGVDDEPDYSPADQQGSSGSSIVEEAAGGSPGGGGYGGTPPVTGVIVPLTGTEDSGYSIAYAADSIGIDARDGAKVTIGANGELNQYDLEPNYEERLERNSNNSLERGNSNDVVFIERWAGGETNGNYYNSNNGTTFSNLGRTSHQGFHLVYAKPTANMPVSGIATYSLAAATKPTIDNGQFAPGTFTGEMSVLFGAQIGIGIDFSVDMPGDYVYSIRTPGGTGSPITSGVHWSAANKTFRINSIAMGSGGAACPTSNCDAMVYGIFAGTNASDVGIAYQIMDFSVSTDQYYRGKRISGTAAFGQSSYDPNATPDIPLPTESGALDAPLVMPSGSTKWLDGYYLVPAVQYAYGRGFGSTNDAMIADETGAITYIQSAESPLHTFNRGTAVTAELYGTEFMQIGRWNGGDIALTGQLPTTVFTPHGHQGLVYLAMVNNMSSLHLPTDVVATYELIGATGAVTPSGVYAPGVFDGSLAIMFPASGGGAPKVGIDARVTMDEGGTNVVYDISTAGGVTSPQNSQLSVYGTTFYGQYNVQSPNGGSCMGSGVDCSVNLTGALGGPQAREAGFRYQIGSSQQTALYGAALFTRNDAGASDLVGHTFGLNYDLRSPNSTVLTNSAGDKTAGNTEITIIDNKVEKIHGYSINYDPGTTTVSDVGGVRGVISWQRWSDGQVGGANHQYTHANLGVNQSMHVLAWAPASNVPMEGVATYSLTGATSPTIADGSAAPGTFTGEMAVAFGVNYPSTKIGLDLAVAIGGHTYNIETTGGALNPGQSQMSLGSNATFSHTFDIAAGGAACPDATCQAKVGGGLAGNRASHAALAYTISANGNPTAKAVQGAAGFTRGAIILP